MNTKWSFRSSRQSMNASALIVALLFVLLLSIAAASLLSFSGSETVAITRRSNRTDALYGAEAAVRRSMAQIRALYFSSYSTNSYLSGNLAAPTTGELDQIATSEGPATVSVLDDRYTYNSVSVAFTTGSGSNPYVSYTIPTTDEKLTTYAGLTSQRASALCSANATAKNSRYQVPATVSQAFNIDYIPVFQYAIFYNMDMECFNGPTMTVNGKVHSNGTMYYAPAATLTINSTLTAADDIERGIKVWDSSKPKLLTAASASIQAQYSNNRSLYEADVANWVSTDPTVSGYGEASFQVKNALTGALVDFRTSASPATFFDSESSTWAGGAVTMWGGGVKSEDQGIDLITPPIPTGVLTGATDPSNPYHVISTRMETPRPGRRKPAAARKTCRPP